MSDLPAGPVTFDDVVRALGEMDPSATNAAKIRDVMGRGSFATIQKHLDRLRAVARTAQEPAQGSEVPNPPADVFATLWGAAYRAAGHLTADRLAALLTERDALRIAGDVAGADVAALAAQVDALETAMATATAAQLLAETAAAQAVEALARSEAASAVRIADLGRAAENDMTKARHELELEQRDRLIERQAQQATTDRLTDQIGELKALLALQARPASP